MTETHLRRESRSPPGWVLYLAEESPERLVVFVHGFSGRAVTSWNRLAESGFVSDWWRRADLLFVGYESTRENVTGAANRLRKRLPAFLDGPPVSAVEILVAEVLEVPVQGGVAAVDGARRPLLSSDVVDRTEWDVSL